MRSYVMLLACGVLACGVGCTQTPTTNAGLTIEDVSTNGNIQVEMLNNVPTSMSDTTDVVVIDVPTAGGSLAPLAVAMSAQNFAFSPDSVVVAPQQDVVMTFSDVDGTHRFVIDELNVHKDITTGSVVTFTAPETPGVYPFYCGVGSHHALGMQGTLLVR